MHEPLRVTLTRTITLAAIAGLVFALSSGGINRWPFATLLMLWPAFGGHWVELWFIDWLRPRLAGDRAIQLVARVAVWFVGGLVLGLGMSLTAVAIGRAQHVPWRDWWIAGVAFVAIELATHAALRVRGQPNAYDGRG